MRILLPIVLALAASACGGGMAYKDTNAAVDANPLCVNEPDRPGEPAVSQDCERKTETTWSSGDDKKQGEPIDFSGKKD
jgi:hypothetical protein